MPIPVSTPLARELFNMECMTDDILGMVEDGLRRLEI